MRVEVSKIEAEAVKTEQARLEANVEETVTRMMAGRMDGSAGGLTCPTQATVFDAIKAIGEARHSLPAALAVLPQAKQCASEQEGLQLAQLEKIASDHFQLFDTTK